jgi:protein-tyrosine phosphatase
MKGTELHWVREIEPGRLALAARPRGNEWLGDELDAWKAEGVRTVVSLLEAFEVRELELEEEARLCAERELDFLSFPIRDRGTPESVAAFRPLIEDLMVRLQREEGVVVHCRMGIGRTGVVGGCVLHLLGVPRGEIFEVLSRARGWAMPDTPEQAKWVEAFCEAADAHL